MLIVCPSCATSYLLNPDSVGPAGRSVRCARCKTTWFAGAAQKATEVSDFVDSVIAEAEAESAGAYSAEPPPRPAAAAPPPDQVTAASDDFGAEASESPPEPYDTGLPQADPETHDTSLVPYENDTPEPVAITDAPALVPPLEHTSFPDTASAELESEDFDTFAVRRQRLKTRRQQARRSSRWTAVMLLLLAFNVALIGARNEVVRYLPQTASLFAAIGLPVNLRHLQFENVHIARETEDGKTILVIEGAIVSTAGKPAEVPRLRFAARNASGQEVYTWTALAGRSILGPDESLEFSSRLVSPPADATDVMVRFFNAKDAAAGTK